MKRPLRSFVVLGALLVACGEEDPRNAVEVAPTTEADVTGSESDAEEPSRTSRAPGSPEAAPQDGNAPQTAPSTENTCATAVDLGKMPGEVKLLESDAVKLSSQGKCTTWVKLRVEETSRWDGPMEVEAVLVSPPTKKFDLLGFVNTAKDEVECATPAATSASTTSNVDRVLLRWTDRWNQDDSRTVTIQVKSRDAACDESSNWSLIVKSVVLRPAAR